MRPAPSAHIVEFSSFRVGVVHGPVGVNFLVAHVLVECDVTASLGIAGVFVVVDLIGRQKYFGSFNGSAPTKVVLPPLGLLVNGANNPIPKRRRVRARYLNAEIRL
jgi:hypothetical protein